MEKIKEVLTWLRFEDLLSYGFWDLLVNVILFVSFAVPTFYFFWVWYKKKFRSRRIQSRRTNFRPSLRREIRNSLMSLLILTIVDILIYLAQLKGYTVLYTNISDYGWAYLCFSIVAMIFLHDTMYYFIHRFMHHPKIYNIVHRVHHQSTDPSPFAAFSFHPLEAFMEGLPYILFAFFLPVHLVALWAWQVVQVVMNVIAHLGYEFYPRGFNTHWFFKFKTPSTHHNMHHERVHGNYGLYFTWWDKIFKTEFKEYNAVYENLQDQIEAAKKIETAKQKAAEPAVAPPVAIPEQYFDAPEAA